MVTGVSHGLYGILGRGPHLIAGRQYRLVAVYQGSPADSIRGAMGMMGGIFAPDHYARWPKLDRSNPDYIVDLNPTLAHRTIAAKQEQRWTATRNIGAFDAAMPGLEPAF
jgi:hypothetical protein